MPSLRSLPRLFLPGVSQDGPIELPASEVEKFRKVLRLHDGDEIAILPNDGSLLRCRYRIRFAEPISVEYPGTEPKRRVTLAQALPKGDRIETVLRMGTEMGVSRFVLFPAVRSVARWEPKKVGEKFRRLEAIVRESAEQSYRARLPELYWEESLSAVLAREPDAVVLSEVEGIQATFASRLATLSPEEPVAIAIGPEGGWDPKEISQIGSRAVSLGPLVLRTDTAGAAAAALALLGTHAQTKS